MKRARPKRQQELFCVQRRNKVHRPIETGNVASDAAADRVRIRTGSQSARIRAAVWRAGPSGLTDTEIETATGIPGNSERPRRLRLVELGYLRLLLGPAPDLSPILRDGRSIYVVTDRPWPDDTAGGGGNDVE